MIKDTGFHDVRGIPIYVGDLIRVKHFKHRRRKQQMWLYFMVGEVRGQYVVHAVRPAEDEEEYRCRLQACGIESAEVLDGDSESTTDGGFLMWCERKRKQ